MESLLHIPTSLIVKYLLTSPTIRFFYAIHLQQQMAPRDTMLTLQIYVANLIQGHWSNSVRQNLLDSRLIEFYLIIIIKLFL